MSFSIAALVTGQASATANADRAPVNEKANEKKKVLKSNEHSGIELTVDVEKQHVVLPKQLYAADPDLFMRKELPFFRECLEAAFGRNFNSCTHLHIIWLTLQYSARI